MTTTYERRCDDSGQFRIELPRTSSARHDALTVTALAPGYGLGWAELDPDAESPTADVALRPEQIIRGRLFDLKGQPARGVRIAVQSARVTSSAGSSRTSPGPMPTSVPGWIRPPGPPRRSVTTTDASPSAGWAGARTTRSPPTTRASASRSPRSGPTMAPRPGTLVPLRRIRSPGRARTGLRSRSRSPSSRPGASPVA